MGGGGAIGSVTKAVKKQAKRLTPKHQFNKAKRIGSAARSIVKGEDVGSSIKSFARDIYSTATLGGSEVAADLGVSRTLINPVGELVGGAAKTFYDKPKKLKAEDKEMKENAAKAQREELEKLRNEESQRTAEMDASDTLARKRRSQRSRRKTGRSGTVLTNALGDTGGDTGGRKTLLGM